MSTNPLAETRMGSLRAFLEDAGTHPGRLITITTGDARDIADRLNAVDAMERELAEARAVWNPSRAELMAHVSELHAYLRRVTSCELTIAQMDRQAQDLLDAHTEAGSRVTAVLTAARAVLGNQGRCQKHNDDPDASCWPMRRLREALDAVEADR